MNELVSVIMPAYNAENTLAMAVDSVLSQTYKNLELIIINDCSKDNTGLLAERYAQIDNRVVVLTNDKNSGVSVTRHNGVQAAKGKWIAFLDSDDAWTPNKLEKQFKVQKKNNAKLIFTGSAFMDLDGNRKDWILHVPEKIGYRKLLKQNLISNSSVLIEKVLYQKYEVIGDNMHEDFACWLKILRTGEVAYGIDEPMLIYRLSTNSKSGNKFKAARMNWNAYRISGLDTFSSMYFMIFYAVNGMRKYFRLRDAL